MSTILIFERSPSLRGDLVHVLERAGFRTQAVETVRALERALEASSCRAALVDVRGEGDLDWLARAMRAAHVPAVFAMGASSSVELAVASMKLGVRDYFRKPFRVDALERQLSEQLRPAALADPVVFRGEDAGMAAMIREARAAAASDMTVVIRGEKGSGRKTLAEWIHAAGRRSAGAFAQIDCATLRDSECEAHVFGREAGAWLDSPEASPGVVARANGGTILLDEIGEASPRTQAVLMRLLEERAARPVGASVSLPVDVRIIATTSRDLRECVDAGEFREDLFYRLDVVSLCVPALRERPGDIRSLADAALRKHAQALGSEVPQLGNEAYGALADHAFPGNLRELDNLMQRAAVLFPGGVVDVDRLLSGSGGPSGALESQASNLNLRELERQAVEQSLREARGNRTHASQLLGINVRTLRNKIRAYGLR